MIKVLITALSMLANINASDPKDDYGNVVHIGLPYITITWPEEIDIADKVVVLLYGTETVREVNEVSDSVLLPELWYEYPVASGYFIPRPQPETYKEVTTVHKRITTLTFKWRGKERIVEDQEILWTTKQKMKLESRWIPDGNACLTDNCTINVSK